jgi:hypothetical protein
MNLTLKLMSLMIKLAYWMPGSPRHSDDHLKCKAAMRSLAVDCTAPYHAIYRRTDDSQKLYP